LCTDAVKELQQYQSILSRKVCSLVRFDVNSRNNYGRVIDRVGWWGPTTRVEMLYNNPSIFRPSCFTCGTL